ncbi:MAG: hypothetical protein U1F30_16825 [Steroidobacteraceae bacterium]
MTKWETLASVHKTIATVPRKLCVPLPCFQAFRAAPRELRPSTQPRRDGWGLLCNGAVRWPEDGPAGELSDLKISACGLSPWELNFLQATVGIASGTDIAQWRFEPDVTQADVVLASADSREGAAWLERPPASRDGAGPLVVPLRTREPDGTDGPQPALGRPIAYPELIALLRRLEGALRGRPHRRTIACPGRRGGGARRGATRCGNTARGAGGSLSPPCRPCPPNRRFRLPRSSTVAPPPAWRRRHRSRRPSLRQPSAAARNEDTVPALRTLAPGPETVQHSLQRKARRAARFFDNTRLLGLVRRAMESGTALEIAHPHFAPLLIFPAEGLYASSADPCAHPEAFRVPAIEFTTRAVGPDTLVEVGFASAAQPLRRLLFTAALYGSEGRLRADHDLEDVLELQDAPNLTSLSLSQAQQSVILSLATAPATLPQLAMQCEVDLDTVIDVVNAIDAVGALRHSRPDQTREATAGPGTGDGHRPTGTSTIQRLSAMLRAVLTAQRP